MKCKNCETELTEMKNDNGEVTCVRCLSCHPLMAYVPPAKKERKDIDLPWTDERVIEIIDKVVPDMVREILENWHIQRPPVTVDEIVEPTEETRGWRNQAKALGIEVYDKEKKRPRLKVDVLKDIEDKRVPA